MTLIVLNLIIREPVAFDVRANRRVWCYIIRILKPNTIYAAWRCTDYNECRVTEFGYTKFNFKVNILTLRCERRGVGQRTSPSIIRRVDAERSRFMYLWRTTCKILFNYLFYLFIWHNDIMTTAADSIALNRHYFKINFFLSLYIETHDLNILYVIYEITK